MQITIGMIRKELMELNIAYPWPKMSAEEIEVLARKWMKAFGGGYAKPFQMAVATHLKKSPRFPTIGEVMAYYRSIVDHNRGRTLIPGFVYREDQDEINRRGIAQVRAALRRGRMKSGNKGGLNV